MPIDWDMYGFELLAMLAFGARFSDAWELWIGSVETRLHGRFSCRIVNGIEQVLPTSVTQTSILTNSPIDKSGELVIS